MNKKGEIQERDERTRQLQFPSLLLRSDAAIKDHSFVAMDLCKNDSRHNSGKVKGKVTPVPNKLSITTRRHLGEWRYCSTTLNLGTGWR
jgi:hypothetical protein